MYVNSQDLHDMFIYYCFSIISSFIVVVSLSTLYNLLYIINTIDITAIIIKVNAMIDNIINTITNSVSFVCDDSLFIVGVSGLLSHVHPLHSPLYVI